MRYLLTTLLFFTVSCASAQIVNIPDTAFKRFLTQGLYSVDANLDGEIQLSEALTITNFNFGYDDASVNIMDLTGIRSFANLKDLFFYASPGGNGPNITELDLSGMPNLVSVRCDYRTTLTTLNVTGCNRLSLLSCHQTSITHLNLSALPNLTRIDGYNMPNLIECIVDDAPRLKAVSLSEVGNASSYFSFKNCDSLNDFQFWPTNANVLDVSGSTMTGYISINGTVDHFIARNCNGPANLDLSGLVSNNIELVDYTGLTTLSFRQSPAQQYYDFSSCINLENVFVSNAASIIPLRMNVKNGTFTHVNLISQISQINICADEFEVDTLRNLIHGPLSEPANINSYCSFLPGGNYNTINGKVKFDIDNNGCDIEDSGIGSVPIKLVDGNGDNIIRYSASTGDFAHYSGAGNFAISAYFPYPYFNLSPASSYVAFDTANNLVDSVAFCISPNGVHNDLDITLLPVGNARPGFVSQYTLVYRNRGTTAQSGSVQLNYDNSKMIFSQSSPAISNQTAGQLTWNYNNLHLFESRTIDISFMMLPPPTNIAGDTIMFLSSINSAAIDETPYNNTFILPQGLRGSYDPNDKVCLQGDKLGLNDIGKPLDYIIHFQNLGTDTAFNIVIADQLSDKFNWNSVDITSSSHPFELREKNGKLEFIFEKIKLPYAAINEPASHGYVAFKVTTKNSLLIGDSLNNKAAIYFDFNLPVITNTAITIVNPTSSVPVKLEYFSLINKNETNQLVWKASSTTGITNFEIERSNDALHFTNIGNLTASAERCQSPFNFTDGKPFIGKTYYRLHIKDANGISFYSKVLLAERTKSGLSIITAVVSDKSNTTIYFNAATQQNVQMKVVAADGRVVYNQTKTIAAGSSIINLPLGNLSSGIYSLIVYTNDGDIFTKRFAR